MILALQYYITDLERTMRLANLLADIEAHFRDDVMLGLICQPGTPTTRLVRETIDRCSRKFPVIQACSKQGGKGWATGSCKLWRGTMLHFYELYKSHQTTHDSIFTLDGGDGVPLHRDWIDLLLREHQLTRSMGNRISGTLTVDHFNQPHINGNMILDLLLIGESPKLLEQPTDTMLSNGAMWDVVNGETFMENSHPSSVICNEWNQSGITMSRMNEIASRSIWLHGYKDPGLRSIARERLMNDPTSLEIKPSLKYYDKEIQKILTNTFTRQDWIFFNQDNPNFHATST